MVEVGVDVPNATLMTIDGGERFGLAQLHQMRGRISRGPHPGYCCVFADTQSEEVIERLQAFVNTTDGFRLAELDLEIRGPGDLLGTRQHGLPPFRMADLSRDSTVVREARDDAQQLFAADPGLRQSEHRASAAWFSRGMGKRSISATWVDFLSVVSCQFVFVGCRLSVVDAMDCWQVLPATDHGQLTTDKPLAPILAQTQSACVIRIFCMSYSSSINRQQPFLIVAVVMMGIAFAVGYAAGSGRINLPDGLSPPGSPAASEDGITVNFSPKGGCTDRVVEEINRAQHEIEMQAYSFTSKPIVHALIAAHHRGVKITAVLDKSNLKDDSQDGELAADKIPVYIDSKHAIAHNKIILIDGQTIITGSFNFTYSAEHSNAENLLVLHGRPKLYAAFDANFKQHLGHSEPFTANMAREPASQRSYR